MIITIPARLVPVSMLIRKMSAYGTVNISRNKKGYTVGWHGDAFTIQTTRLPTLKLALLKAHNTRL